MKNSLCERCGANDWEYKNGQKVCKFCGTAFVPEAGEFIPGNSAISVGDDVKILLEKCAADPRHAKKYANLILDIDPSNKEALKYINGGRI